MTDHVGFRGDEEQVDGCLERGTGGEVDIRAVRPERSVERGEAVLECTVGVGQQRLEPIHIVGEDRGEASDAGSRRQRFDVRERRVITTVDEDQPPGALEQKRPHLFTGQPA